jgi:hypothetical protein
MAHADWFGSETLIYVVEVLTAAGRYSDARETAQAIVKDRSRAKALIHLAGALTRVGRHDEARQIADEAHTAAQAITDDWSRGECLNGCRRHLNCRRPAQGRPGGGQPDQLRRPLRRFRERRWAG